ncbi:fatty acid--CoA ligase (plasmid) [Mycolicibacterium madagascariense]|uniref:Fatty acid--CoA ligase n=1 Tax=Mycolicibacterium madagascariense TaxID=212765 RepID=A0A7I7XQ45_9MYCO|nr:class I adenylate-forming enzyme family protein [Mycolicibacterium madagascariense]BBZ31233.1 fatty acid--CoA ligase [Mycolicibacterium madagascariense]
MALSDADRLALLTGPQGTFPLRQRHRAGHTVEVFDREPRTLRDAFLALSGFGDRVAIVYEQQRWSFAELASETARVAQLLTGHYGIRKGDRVGIAMRNYPEFVFVFAATQIIGAVAVPLNAWLRQDELVDLLNDATPDVLIADQARVDFVHGQVSIPVVGVRATQLPDGVGDYDALVNADRSSTPTVPEVSVEPDDPATILFTSGTTAKPKAVVHTHQNHSASLLNKLIRAVQIAAAEPGAAPVVSPPAAACKLVTFPFFHIAGINTMYNTLYSGQSLVLMYKWDAHEAVRLVDHEGVTEISGAPFVVQTFLAAARDTDHDLGSLRSLGMGGGAAPQQLISAIDDVFGGSVTPRTGYGMTETTSGIVAISGEDLRARPTSVGRSLPTVEVAIVDGDHQSVSPGDEGQVAVRGPQVIDGYQGGVSAESFVDGWFLTGDLGRRDEDGFIYLVGRLKDVVIRGGENVSCLEVEQVLERHPAVVEAAVLGAPHDTLGEEVVAVVSLAADAPVEVSPAELTSFAGERLAAFKVPARVAVVRQPLPRTASGKVIKRDLVRELDLQWLLAAGTVSM